MISDHGGLGSPTLRVLDFGNSGYNSILVNSNKGPRLMAISEGYAITIASMGFTSTDNSANVPFFYDVMDDGVLDIMITSYDGTGITALWNNLDTSDHYFFTATTLNGVAEKPTLWGGVQVGAVHRFQWQNIEQHLKTTSGTQLASAQYLALNLPRMHFGLSKTFGYIQNYATGMLIDNGNEKSYHSWTSYMVPNSQVMCPAHPITDSSEWSIKLFFAGSRYVVLICISLATALVLVGIPIVVLRFREYKADNKEKGYLH